MLSSENMYDTRHWWWGIQWNLNSLVFAVFSWLCVFMKVTPLFYLSQLYSSYAFDIWYVLCVCVCVGVVSDFTYSYFFSVYVWMCVLRFFPVCMYVCGNVVWNIQVIIFFTNNFSVYIYIYIYIYIYVCFLLYTCIVHVLFDFGLNLSINFFSFIWSSVSSLFWYMSVILNLLWLHSYRCFDTFSFVFCYFIPWSDVLVLRACVDPMYISLYCRGGMYLVISVDIRPYFTGIALNIISSTNTTQNFTIA